MNEKTLLALAVLTFAITVYKRRLHRKIRNKKRMSSKYNLTEKD